MRLRDVAVQALDGFGSKYAICNVLHGAQSIFSEDLSAAFCRAINDWVAKEWLDRDPRLRASIVVPMHSPELSAREIERCAADPRFVQVLVWEMQEIPLGRRQHWPIYRVAEQLDLPIGIHAGSSYRHPPTNLGWPSYYLEDYVSWSTGFAGVLNSLISEGVFVEFPRLKVVLMESGVTWLPAWMWRANKTWRGVRAEVPWLEKSPPDYRPRTCAPDVPAVRRAAQRGDVTQNHRGDRLRGHAVVLDRLSALALRRQRRAAGRIAGHLMRRSCVDNAMKTYPRLTGR